jgi:hypothetical protein
LDRAALLDGDLQSDADASVLTYRKDFSLRPVVDLPHMRYRDLSVCRQARS